MEKFLFSDKVLLRGIKEEDVDAIFSYRSMPDVARFQYWKPYTKEQTVSFVHQHANTDLNKKSEWIGLAIININNSKLIGDCALKIRNNTAEIGCNISPTDQKKGFAKDTLNLLFSHCFNTIGVDEIYGITDSENTASIKLMESLKMTKSKYFEKQIICKEALCIEHKYSIKRLDYYL